MQGDPGEGLLPSHEVVHLQGAAPQHAALASLLALHQALPRKSGSILHALPAWGKTLFLNLQGFLEAGGQDEREVQL